MAIYLLIFAIAGRFAKQKKSKVKDIVQRKTAVFIPAYKEDTIIINTAAKALEQSYPSYLFDVIVIADSLKTTTLSKLKALPIKVIEVQFEVSSKAKSLNKAMQVLPAYQTAVVLDADNVMEHSFLAKVNAELNKGFLAVQGNRTAKNINTNIAKLDAISEATNNYILRKGHVALGLSAALVGSGMAFDYLSYKNKMANIDCFGEDKELELEILKEGKKIQYLEDAIVYDEKTQNVSAYRKQRTRWIAAQFGCLKKYFYSAIYELLFKGNFDFFNKVFQTTFLPRIISFGMLCLGIIGSLLLNNNLIFYVTTVSAVFFILAFILSVPSNLLATLSIKDLSRLPILFTALIISFYKIREAKKSFIHTPKNVVT